MGFRLSGQTHVPAEPVKNPPVRSREAVQAGRVRYQRNCGACHGVSGQGGRGPKLANAPRLRDMTDEKIFEVIRDGVAGTEMMAFPLPDPQIWEVVAFIRSLNAVAVNQDVPGDTAAGREVFFGKVGCTKCHSLRGRGGFLGPDLSNIGANRSIQEISEAIRNPSAYVEPGFRRVSVVTKEGQRVEGIIRNDSNYSIQILDMQGRFQLFLKMELSEIVYYRDSLMPAPSLSETEIQNLLAFLSRQALEMSGEQETSLGPKGAA